LPRRVFTESASESDKKLEKSGRGSPRFATIHNTDGCETRRTKNKHNCKRYEKHATI